MTLAAHLQQLVDDPSRPVSGVAAGLWVNGQVICSAHAGWQQMGQAHPEGSIALSADSLFRIASVSKLAVAIIQMRLHEAGLLGLDQALPALVRHPRHQDAPITPRLLLTHRSSLRDTDERIDPGPDGLRQALADPRHWAEPTPGMQFAYCNLGFIVLATAMERACGKRFDAIAQEWLFEPLGLQARFHAHSLSAASRQRLATLYRRPMGVWTAQVDAPEAIAEPTPPPQLGVGVNAACFSPQGGLRIGIGELLRLGELLAEAGVLGSRQVLGLAAWQEMLRPHWQWRPGMPGSNEGGLFRSWALGLQRFTDQNDAHGGDRLHSAGGWQAWGHRGQAYGLFSGLLFSPARPGRSAWAMAYAITGQGVHESQAQGEHSSFTWWEEQVLAPLLNELSACV